MKKCISILLIFVSFSLAAHEGHHHGTHSQESKIESAGSDLDLVYAEINKMYRSKVEPIFNKKCADCHSAKIAAPWYGSIPIIHQLIESDRTEAKEHLEISNGFPFAGHGTPEEDLKAISDVTSKNTMPTRLYSMMHPASRLTNEEKKAVVNWTNESADRINSAKQMEK